MFFLHEFKGVRGNSLTLFFMRQIVAAFVYRFRNTAVSGEVYFRFEVAQEVGLEITHEETAATEDIHGTERDAVFNAAQADVEIDL